MAADESISVEIKDGVDKSVARNISAISTAARNAYQNVEKLTRQLNRVKPTAIAQFNSVVSNAQKQMQGAALSAQRLATEQARTAQASTNSATAQQRLATATARTTTAENAAAGSALRLEAAQTRAAAAADRQAAAQGRAAAATTAAARNMAAQEVEVTRVQGVHDRFNKVLARSPQYQKAFTAQNVAMAKSAALNRHELINLSHQVNDVVVSLGSGQKPLTVLLQQGAQIGQIFGGSGAGAGAIFRQLASIVGTLVSRLAPLGILLSAVLIPFGLFVRELNKGIDSKKLVDGLKLTEDQLKQLKKSGEETKITFGDSFKATFQVIGQYASTYLKPVIDTISKWWKKELDTSTKSFATFIRRALGDLIAFANVVKVIWSDIPAAIGLFMAKGINAAIKLVELGINTISQALSKSPLGQLLGMGSVKIELPKIDETPYAKTGDAIKQAIVDGYKTADNLVTKFGKDVRAQAFKNAQARLRKAAGEDDSAGKKPKGFDRAKELAEINAQLDSQAKHMFALSTARDALNRAEEIALRFAKEGKPLTESEIDSLRKKIQALNDAKEIQTQFDRIYQSAIGPQREYTASLAAADKLLKMGAISQAQYNAELARAEDAFKNASDPLYQMNKELDEQVKLLGMLGPQREIEQQVMQAINKALQDGKTLREDEVKLLREKLGLVQQLSNIAAFRDEIQAGSSAQQSVNRASNTQTAIREVGNNGVTGGDAVSALAQENPGLQATSEYQQSVIASYTDMYAQIDALRQADVISETSAIQAKMTLFQEQYATQIQGVQTALGALASLQNSSNKKQAAIGKKAAIAQTVINTYQSATAAFSSLASIPYVGPFLGAAAAAAAIAAGMANVQQIRATNAGFKEGGYTGNIPTNAIAGPVHGKEYVFDAPATSRIGVGNLESLRRGRVPVQSLMSGESSASEQTASTSVRGRDGDVNYNQVVNVTVAGKRDRRTAEQEARAIRRESTKELIRSGG